MWNQDHKSGEKFEPNIYGDITLPNCIGKFFNTVFYKRLEKDTKIQKLSSPAQCRFGKNHRKNDDILNLFNIMKKPQKWKIPLQMLCKL